MYMEKHVLAKKCLKWAKYRFAITRLGKKESLRSGNTQTKENIPGAMVSKEDHADSLLGLITIDFLDKDAIVNSVSFC